MDFSNLQQAKALQSLTDGKLNEAKNQPDAKKASQQFEAMFVKQMFKAMTETVEDKSLFGSGPGSDYYNDIFLDKMAEQVSQSNDLGLAKTIYRQITNEVTSQQKPEIRNLNDSDFAKVENSEIEKIYEKIRLRNAQEAEESQNAENKVIANIGEVLHRRLKKFGSIIQKASEMFGVDEKLIKAVISQESYANPKAVSHAGAKGLMQLMDGTAEGLGVKDSFDPEENILAGTKYLKIMMARFNDKKLALAAYNAGAGNVIKYNGIPPFKETQNYVSKVMQYYKKFQ